MGTAAKRGGSDFSDRQIAWTVRSGRRVTAWSQGATVTGYVFGVDTYHLGLVDVSGGNLYTYLVPKSAMIQIETEGSYADEPQRESLEPLVAPYRRTVMEKFFSHADDTLPAAPAIGRRNAEYRK